MFLRLAMAKFLTERLFEDVLVKPAGECDRVSVVSGYATPGLCHRHLEEVVSEGVAIDLLIGMIPVSGIPLGHHQEFLKIQDRFSGGALSVFYLKGCPPVHSKVYAWRSGDAPAVGYCGSANYTNGGFFGNREALSECDPGKAVKYFDRLCSQGVPIHRAEEEGVSFRELSSFRNIEGTQAQAGGVLPEVESVATTLLTRSGEVAEKSGLNWGQGGGRPRNPNEAYLPVPAEVAKKGFFPPKGQYFTVVTDDDESFTAVVAQSGDKAIETPYDNRVLGRYFRERFGLAEEEVFTRKALEERGCSLSPRWFKFDDENYLLDLTSDNEL